MMLVCWKTKKFCASHFKKRCKLPNKQVVVRHIYLGSRTYTMLVEYVKRIFFLIVPIPIYYRLGNEYE